MVDRPGDWGSLYDDVISTVKAVDLVVLGTTGDPDDAYARVTQAIVEEAVTIGRERGESVVAVSVWEGKPRGAGDITAQFVAAARKRGIPVEQVLTLPRAAE